MRVGNLVTVLYETTRYYIVLEKAGRRGLYGEQLYRLFNIQDGSTRDVAYSQIKTVSGVNHAKG